MWNTRLNTRPVVLLARLYLGGILLIAGSNKAFVGGIEQFSALVHSRIQIAVIPGPVLTGFGYVFPYFELVLGMLLVLGFLRQLILPTAALTFLIVSQVHFVFHDYALATTNGIFLIVTLLALAFAQKPTLSLDNLFD